MHSVTHVDIIKYFFGQVLAFLGFSMCSIPCIPKGVKLTHKGRICYFFIIILTTKFLKFI